MSSCSVMGRVSRRDAETRRRLLCVAFSQRLCASAGHGFRYCVVEFRFHRVAGGGRLEEEEWGEFVFGHGVSFPQRR